MNIVRVEDAAVTGRPTGNAGAGRPVEEPSTDGLSDARIVEAARNIIAEVGVNGLTMRRLSADLGVALGATYHHVPNKHELLLLVGRDIYVEAAGLAPEGSWDTRLRTLVLQLASAIGQYPGMAAFMVANTGELVTTELNRAVRQILRQAGFGRRGIDVVMAAMFFYVTGLSASGFLDQKENGEALGDMQSISEGGLDLLLDGARVRLEADIGRRRRTAARRRASVPVPGRASNV